MAVDQYDFTASANLAAGEYDDATSTMTIEFQNGRSYRYERVDPVLWDRLKSAPSAGIFLNANFKRGNET